MKPVSLVGALCGAALLAAPAIAQFYPDGRPAEAGSNATHTVAQAREARDETRVVLEGRILERIREEHYRFSDGSGEIRLDIGDEAWRGAMVGPDDRVRISGEIDRGLGFVEIWVHEVSRVEAPEVEAPE